MNDSTLAIAKRDGKHATLTPEERDRAGLAARRPPPARGEQGWDDAVLIWNGMAATTPALVVQPSSAADVAAAVAFARDHGLLVERQGRRSQHRRHWRSPRTA